jgi:type IV pilus assembly protein PilW
VSRRQHGIALAELLVSMGLGLAVLLAAATLMVTANAAYVAQAESASAEEGARYALDMLARAVRQAGYVDWEDPAAGADDAAPARIAGLDARTLSKASAGIDGALGGGVNGSDVLALRFAGAGEPPDGDASMLSCAGFAVHRHEEGWSIFYVARSAQGQPELRCKYKGASGWGADAVIAGVDTFQVLYGLDTDAVPDGVPNRYLNASAIDALDAALVLSGSSAHEREDDLHRRTWWKRVASVQLALLLRGARTRDASHGTHALFGPAYAGDADPGTLLSDDALSVGERREHRLFTTTVALRNGVRR